VAQRVGRGIALLFHDRGTRRGGVSGQQDAPAVIYPWERLGTHLQEAGWAPGLVWMGGKSRPHRDSIPDSPARSQSLYRLRYRAHIKYIGFHVKGKVMCTLVEAMRLCTGRTAYRRSRGIALLFLDHGTRR